MMSWRRIVSGGALSAVLVWVGVAARGAPPAAPGVPAARALATLKAGNDRFVAGRPDIREILSARRAAVRGQSPHTIVIGCSDSRVPPELVFDENVGQLFVVRTAGNVVDPVTLGSAEYGATVLGARLLVILGHESCGAVSAALAGKPAAGNLPAVIDRIAPAAAEIRGKGLAGRAESDAAVEANVRLQLRELLSKSEVLSGLKNRRALTVLGAVYDLETGRVRWQR